MRVRFGGSVIDLRNSAAGLTLVAFILFMFVVLSHVTSPKKVKRSSESLELELLPQPDPSFAGAADDAHPPVPNLLPVPPEVPKVAEEKAADITNVAMVMEAARGRYDNILQLQKQILTTQNRPPDSHYNINITLSDMISMDRKIEDTRPEPCKAFTYDRSKLPKASVIIPFYNEALSMLLRTVHSVLNNSPEDLLQEVILVDDKSTRDYLGETFAKYMSMLPKVKLLRNSHRSGLIVSRLRGSRLAQGPVVIFLDAHTEANTGWLEPMLDEIQRHPESVVQPFVDGIDAQSIEYSAPPSLYMGSFSWDLRYTWLRVPDHDAQRSLETGFPFFSPTLVGCAIAVDKNYFEKIGEFDEGLRVWGGENIELGFRAWQCGGRVVTVICSRVGHVFKNFPYKFDGDREEIVAKNLMRVAETWMDSYRKFYYASARVYEFKRTEFTKEEQESVKQRIALRQKLGCKNFQWYMQNIIPQLETPPMESVYYGEIQNMRTKACWEVLDDYYIGMNYLCFEHKIIPRNFFSLTKEGLLKYKDKCVGLNPPDPVMKLVECPQSNFEEFGVWRVENKGHTYGRLRASRRRADGTLEKFCIMQVTNVFKIHSKEQMPEIARCDENNEFQTWIFTWKFQWDQVPAHVLNSSLL